jgi:plasmid stabilization system protein ParE
VRLRYTLRAQRDLEAIYAYIDKHNPPAARAVKRAIQHTIELLADFPYLGVKVDDHLSFAARR